MRSPTRAVGERGAGTIVSLALVVIIVGVALLLVNFTSKSLRQARLNAEADNAAIAAADALRGLVAGYPCDVAKQLASVTHCEVIANDVLIEVARGGQLAKARAGEPG